MNLSEYCRILHSRLPLCLAQRTFVTSSALCGRKATFFQKEKYKKMKMTVYKNPHPFDERFYISSKDVSRHKEHGSEWAEKYVEERYMYAPQRPGIKLKSNEQFKTVKEMVPEFVVPDLTGFELKPYVTYNTEKTITQTEFTAKNLFDATYGSEVVTKYKENVSELDKVTPDELLEKSSFNRKT